MTIETTFDLDHLLAVKQMVHFLSLQHSVQTIDDKQEVRRTTDILDQLVTQHGMSAFYEAICYE